MSTNNLQNFEDLPDSERTLLWAIRVWVIGHCQRQDVSGRLTTALRQRGAEGALGYLEGFMGALSRGASRPIHLLCLCRSEVSADERLTLDAFALLQQDEADEAESLLGAFLTERAAREAIRSAESMAHEFLDAGLVLPPAAMADRRVVAEAARVLH